jgi:hypothetical protein
MKNNSLLKGGIQDIKKLSKKGVEDGCVVYKQFADRELFLPPFRLGKQSNISDFIILTACVKSKLVCFIKSAAACIRQ